MDGWIILDKPIGMNSRRAGGILARMFSAKTFGHMGTLDPMASGLLPIALGNATKMIPFWTDENTKEYLFGLRFGIDTDTLDITGKIKNQNNIIPDLDSVIAALKQLTGAISQVPPNFSAIHINGHRAHKLARSGTDFEMPARGVNIYELEFIGMCDDDWQFRVLCSPGTYVRSIARDIAEICGTIGVASMIRRVRTNGLYIKNAVKLDLLENLFNNDGDFRKYLEPMDFGLGDIPVLNLTDSDIALYKNGGFIGTNGQIESGNVRVYANNQLIGIGEISDDILRPKRTLV